MAFRVGLTGGIASGKSTAAKFFRDLGVSVIDLDQISREVVEKGSFALTQIQTQFGDQVITDEGHLDRAAMRGIVFGDAAKKQWLEELLHPLIRSRQEELISNAIGDYVTIEIPLLVENQLQNTVDRVLVVDLEEQAQLRRAMDRDESTESEVRKIISSQASREERLRVADDIILNDGDMAHLKDRVSELHQLYTELAKSS